MTTTQLTAPVADAAAEVERLVRRLAGLDVAWRLDVEHYGGEVRMVLSLPPGIAVPLDAGPSALAVAYDELRAEHGLVVDALAHARTEAERDQLARAEALADRDTARQQVINVTAERDAARAERDAARQTAVTLGEQLAAARRP